MSPKQKTSKKNHTQRSRRIARLWSLARELGMDSEHLHVVVEMTTGHESIRQCTLQQINQSVAVLESHKRTRPRRTRPAGPNIARLPSPEQRRLARNILDDISQLMILKNPGGYLDGVAKKRCGKTFARLNADEMQDVIEALKNIRRRLSQ